MAPFFSVIIPAYNCGHLISETLDSALAQEFDDFEIIIINDGSLDNTKEVIDGYASADCPRIEIVDQENRGEGGARNTGIQQARGRYIALLDQDDLWYPWTLRTYYEVLTKNDFPAILIGSGQEFSDDTIEKSVKKKPLQTKYFADYISSAKHPYIPAGTPGTVVRTDEARRVGGLSTVRIVGLDQELFYKLGDAKGLIHVLSPTTVAIRRHAGNLQKNIEMTANGALFLINQERENQYPGGNERKWLRRIIIGRLMRAMSVQCLNANYRKQAWEIYVQTFGWHIRLGRIKYLLGFPVKLLFERIFK